MLKVLLIVEGNEEEAFFEVVKDHGLDKERISLEIVNAQGSGNIAALFQDYLSDSGYDAVYCVYDVDNKPFEKKSSYREVREGLKKVLALEARIDSISICTNPNALLLFSSEPTRSRKYRGTFQE